MKRVVLESPFAGNIKRNIAYAKLCVKDCLKNNEGPIVSHLVFPQPGILDDTNKEERALGIEAGHIWIEVADYMTVYTDFGISSGMLLGIERADAASVLIEYRTLPKEQVEELKKKYPD